VFLRNETRAKSGFVSYVSISMCFDFDPNSDHSSFFDFQQVVSSKTKSCGTA